MSNNRTLSSGNSILVRRIRGPLIVFHVFVARSSQLRRLRYFRTRFCNLSPLILCPYKRCRHVQFRMVFTLSRTIIRHVALIMMNFRTVRCASSCHSIHRLRARRLTFRLPGAYLIFPHPFRLLLTFFLLLRGARLILVLIVLNFRVNKTGVINIIRILTTSIRRARVVRPCSGIHCPVLLTWRSFMKQPARVRVLQIISRILRISFTSAFGCYLRSTIQ